MVTFDFEFIVDAPAEPLWVILKDCTKLQIIFSMISDTRKSVQLIEGVDGEVGAVRLHKYGAAMPPGSYVKQKISSIDHAQKCVVIEDIEGGHLANGCSKWVLNVKLTEVGDMKTKVSYNFNAEGEESAVKAGIEEVKQGSPYFFSFMAKHVKDGGLTA